jgi:hypothetical protein
LRCRAMRSAPALRGAGSATVPLVSVALEGSLSLVAPGRPHRLYESSWWLPRTPALHDKVHQPKQSNIIGRRGIRAAITVRCSLPESSRSSSRPIWPTAATELQRIEQRTKQMHQTNALLRKHQGSYATPQDCPKNRQSGTARASGRREGARSLCCV